VKIVKYVGRRVKIRFGGDRKHEYFFIWPNHPASDPSFGGTVAAGVSVATVIVGGLAYK
jgi:hypothetical protein